MNLQFEIFPDDVIAYNLYCSRSVPHFRQAQARSRMSMAFIFIAATVIARVTWSSVPILAVVAAPIATMIGMILLYHIFFLDYSIKKMTQKQITKGLYNKGLGPQSMVITPENYVCTNAYLEVKRPWQTIESIEVTNQYAFIFVDKTCAEIVPKRVFSDDAAWQQFVAQIRAYYSAGQKSHLLNFK